MVLHSRLTEMATYTSNNSNAGRNKVSTHFRFVNTLGALWSVYDVQIDRKTGEPIWRDDTRRTKSIHVGQATVVFSRFFFRFVLEIFWYFRDRFFVSPKAIIVSVRFQIFAIKFTVCEIHLSHYHDGFLNLLRKQFSYWKARYVQIMCNYLLFHP